MHREVFINRKITVDVLALVYKVPPYSESLLNGHMKETEVYETLKKW